MQYSNVRENSGHICTYLWSSLQQTQSLCVHYVCDQTAQGEVSALLNTTIEWRPDPVQ